MTRAHHLVPLSDATCSLGAAHNGTPTHHFAFLTSQPPRPAKAIGGVHRLRAGTFVVELTGFEPVAPSLRKTRTKRCDLGFQAHLRVLWRGCGTSDVRRRETRQRH